MDLRVLKTLIRGLVREAMSPGLAASSRPRRVVPFRGPKCAECRKELTPNDRAAYEAEGGTGWPEICEDCAEEADYAHAEYMRSRRP